MNFRFDERFLTLHPATERWWQQRDKCRGCAYAEITLDAASSNSGAKVMRCLATKRRVGSVGAGKTIHAYCIDARDDGQPCGPDARLFKEKK